MLGGGTLQSDQRESLIDHFSLWIDVASNSTCFKYSYLEHSLTSKYPTPPLAQHSHPPPPTTHNAQHRRHWQQNQAAAGRDENEGGKVKAAA